MTVIGRHGAKQIFTHEVSLISPHLAKGSLRLRPNYPANRVKWRIRAQPDEKFLGFGERFNAVDQTGNKLKVWTEEGAVGLGEKWGRWLKGLPINPFPHGPTTAYKPMPFFISSRGYGLWLDTFARVEYDVASSRLDMVEAEIWDRSFDWYLIYGPEPSEIVERFTELTGRCQVPKPWTFIPWNDAVTGEKEVLKVANTLRKEKIPSSVIWSEDWQGGKWMLPGILRNYSSYVIFPFLYRLDRKLYPNAEKVAEELHKMGYRWLSYFFPYILRGNPTYREAKKKGYLLKNHWGHPACISILLISYGQIDLTNPEAREWYMKLLEDNLEIGFDGWMADFGEYTPPGTIAFDGEPGIIHHNRFPLLWQELNREVLERARPDGDYMFFCRSAAVGSQKYVPVFWSGDSNTDFEESDGMPSNLPAVLSAGICGLSIWAADLGGYMCITTRGRDKEVFFRWTELCALLSVMRTHHGTAPSRCWQFDHDRKTLDFYKIYARLHAALFPYIYTLVHEAAGTGMPVVRHLILHYPYDKRSWSIEDQFLLGDRLLVAPVIKRGARSRRVYFPPGKWVDYWTGDLVEGPRTLEVEAPLEMIPIYVKSGTVIPTYDRYFDTLANQIPGSTFIGPEAAHSRLRITLYGEGADRYRLWDRTEVEMSRDKGISPEAFSRLSPINPTNAEPIKDDLQPESWRNGAFTSRTIPWNQDKTEIDLRDGDKSLASGCSRRGPSRELITFCWR